MIQFDLTIRERTSKILVGGKLRDAASFFPGKKVIFLADENVIHFHRNSFPDLPIIPIGSGENVKSLEQVIKLYHVLLKLEVDRNSTIIGVGGGVTTDVTGFVASTFLRGLPFGFVATTLLGQVDAAIGGKNGVNLDRFKNMVGLIRQPEFVICDLETLSTLNKKEFIAGFAEVIKYGAIRHPSLFSYLEDKIEEGTNMNMEVMEKLVAESVRSKIEVVKNDEEEHGERKTLNFGHTFAHAFEKLYKISHGEAVAIGMVLAAQMSVNLRILQYSKAEQLQALIKRSGLPISLDFDVDAVSNAMKKDKKRAGGEIRFILLEDIGKAVIKSINLNDIKSILYDLR
jgi:3-dehydroquinate synthase